MFFPIIRRDPCRLHIGKTFYNLLYIVPGDTKFYHNKIFNSNNIYYKKNPKSIFLQILAYGSLPLVLTERTLYEFGFIITRNQNIMPFKTCR